MKKSSKFILSFVLSILLLSIHPATVFAYEYGTPDLNSMIEIDIYGNKEIRSISRDNVNRIRVSKSNKYKNKTDKEKLWEILNALEFNIDIQQFEKASETLQLSHIDNIQVENSYVKSDKNGDAIQISKDEAMKSVMEDSYERFTAITGECYTANSSTTSPTSSHGMLNPWVDENGYMQLQIIVFYTPNYHGVGTTVGRYVIWGFCNWLKYFSTRATDIIGLGATNFSWNNLTETNDTDSFNLLVSYYENISENGKNVEVNQYLDTIDTSKANRSLAYGVYFKYKLPKNSNYLGTTYTYTDFGFLITGVGYANGKYQPDKFIDVGLTYIHIKNAISISPSVDKRGSFSFGVSWTHIPKYYETSYRWYYGDDYNA